MPKSKPRHLPLRPEIGPPIGYGHDNAVFDLVNPHEKPHLRTPTGWVVKVNHAYTDHLKQVRGRHSDPLEAAERGIKYKKNKYDILKYFLGDFIPESGFVLTRTSGTRGERYAEMTLQQKVPKFSLSDLSPEQQADPRLHANLKTLMSRMQHMYSVLGEVNARSSQGRGLDAKLDLGGISDVIRAEDIDHKFDDSEIAGVIKTNTSPNLLVDPDTMQLYCIDFDQGQWEPGMDASKALAFEIDARRSTQAPLIGQLAV